MTEEIGNVITNDKDLQIPEIRKEVDKIFSDLEGDLSKIVLKGNFEPEKIFEELISGERLQDLSQKTKDKIEDISIKIGEKLKEKFSNGLFESNTNSSTEDKVSGTNTPVNSTRLTVEGTQPITPSYGLPTTLPKTQKLNVEFGGKIPDFNVNFKDAPQNMTPQQIEEWKKIFKSVVNEQYFRNYLIKVYDPNGTEVPAY
jgi:hypothetical protein